MSPMQPCVGYTGTPQTYQSTPAFTSPQAPSGSPFLFFENCQFQAKERRKVKAPPSKKGRHQQLEMQSLNGVSSNPDPVAFLLCNASRGGQTHPHNSGCLWKVGRCSLSPVSAHLPSMQEKGHYCSVGTPRQPARSTYR